ncbi:MAG TPA: cupin domain-containing protein [Caulobacteraceae bacterium]|jgi:mannose-6-phosphate isomerase-like protein (cupin superfamily)
MTEFDLEKTYLFIDGAGGLVAQAVGPDFWAEIAANPNAGNTMVSASEGRGDWTRWEMHPNGAEVLVILQGAPRVWLEHPDGRLEAVAAREGSTVIVPRGAWHRAECTEPYKILYITYGVGTTHRPVTDEDRVRAKLLASAD